MEQDVSREGVTGEKVWQLGRLLKPSLNHAIAKVSSFQMVDIVRINELLGTNFKGVILDIDECVAPHHGEVLAENTEHIIRMVIDGIKIVIFSNMKASDRYDPLISEVSQATGYEIQIIMSSHAKPDPRGFSESVKALQLGENEQALMIGDNFVTDGGAINAGVPFVKVKPVKTPNESFLKKGKRSFQTGSRAFYNFVSYLYDLLSGRRVLRDEDLSKLTD